MITRPAARRIHCRLERFHHQRKWIGQRRTVHSRFNRPTTLVAEHDDQLRVLLHLDGILNAADCKIVQDVASHANDEQISNAAVKHDLRRNARIGTAQNDSEWRLMFRHRMASLWSLVRVQEMPSRDPPVSIATLQQIPAALWSGAGLR